MRDIIIVGGGPAGVSAALYSKARGKDVCIIEKDALGGLVKSVSLLSHFVGLSGQETGPSFVDRMKKQLDEAGIPLVQDEIIALEKVDDVFVVRGKKLAYSASKVVLALGSVVKELDPTIVDPSLVYHWALGQEAVYENKVVIMNGAGDGACKEALYISQRAKKVHLLCDQETLSCIDEFKKKMEANPRIEVHLASTLASTKVVDGLIKEAALSSGPVLKDDQGLIVFVQIGQSGAGTWLKDLLAVKQGFVEGPIQSSIDGLFVAGDIRVKPVRQIATAVSDAAQAGILASR